MHIMIQEDRVMEVSIKYCNCCGKEFHTKQDTQIVLEDFVQIDKVWGYFSKKDGLRQKMNICESCFEKWVAAFQVPPEEMEQKELI